MNIGTSALARTLALAALVAGTGVAAGCKSPANVADEATLAPSPSVLAASAAALAVRAVGEAAGLAIAGRRESDPSKLVDAAELMLALQSVERAFPGQTAEPDAPGSLTPAALLVEAEAMGPVDAELATRIEAARSRMPAPAGVPSGAGAERGPQRYSASVRASAHRRHELYFEGAAPAVIQVRGSGATNLDVFLFDVNGDRVAADEGPSDVATVHWYVPYTQTLTLVVRNRGPRANAYYVITN